MIYCVIKEQKMENLIQNEFLYSPLHAKARIESSPNFKNGRAQNREPIVLGNKDTESSAQDLAQLLQPYNKDSVMSHITPSEIPQSSHDLKTRNLQSSQNHKTPKPKSLLRELLSPDRVIIPSVKSDLLQAPKEDSFVWFGHSSLLLWLNGKTLLVDPVLKSCASPLPWVIPPFAGADIYSAHDLPKIDYLLITHNHYDHLSKRTLRDLRGKIGCVITPLGVGKYLVRFGIEPCQIIELDWDEHIKLDSTLRVHYLTARHFSGRGIFDRDKSLWTSFVLESQNKKIFLSGDGGYGAHFGEIGARFGGIDFAFIENGQYNLKWAQVHSFPHESLQALKDLRAKKAMPIHNSKFKISTHSWRAPLDSLLALYERDLSADFVLLTPKIGAITPLWQDIKTPRWWQEVAESK